jgi:hypothetical protein
MKVSPDGPLRYLCSISDPESIPKRLDAVDAVCEMVVELAWEQIRSNPSWLCLHCAAVEMNGRLVLFPNRRRAGKSTLTAVLASRGYRVFTDDFLPISVDPGGYIHGRANGILPRIRLPLPDDFSDAFKDWAAHDHGPRNERYKYLQIETLADRGSALPIGAVVVLNRDKAAECSLHVIDRETVLNGMIAQNFARTLHSGKILQASNGVTETAELFRLDFGSAEVAADLLEEKFRTWPNPIRAMKNPHRLQEGGADLSLLASSQPTLLDGRQYCYAKDVTEVQIHDTIYLSDAFGLGVHRLNQGSSAIWRLFQEPTSLAEVAELLAMAFPDVPAEQINQDSRRAMTQFVENRLIVLANEMARSGS